MKRPSALLVVDDDAALRRLLRRALPAAEFAVTEAGTLEAARAAARRAAFAVLICDVHLPDGDGLEFVEEFGRLRPAAGAIVMTGQPTSELRDRALALGAAFLTKPFEIAQLLAAVDAARRPGGPS